MSSLGPEGLIGGADRVCRYAPVAHDTGVCVEGLELRFRAWKPAIDGAAVAVVVGLVGGMASVTEDDHRGDFESPGQLMQRDVAGGRTHSCYPDWCLWIVQAYLAGCSR